MRKLVLMMFISVMLSACGSDDSGKAKAPAAADPAAATAMAANDGPGEITPGVAKEINGIMIVDHARDEKEFQLRRSLSGVEAMLGSARKAGQDTAELEARLGELQQQLKTLLSG